MHHPPTPPQQAPGEREVNIKNPSPAKGAAHKDVMELLILSVLINKALISRVEKLANVENYLLQ